MKTSPVFQFVFRVLAVFSLTASLFLGTESGASAQGEIGSPEHPIKILFMPSVETQVILDGGQIMTNYLNQGTDLSFEVIVPSSFAATVEELCASPDDSMGFLPGFGYVLANDLCGVDVSYKAIRYGWDVYWSEILVPRDSDINSIADLDGLTWGIPDYGSASGYMAPLVMWAEAGITPGEIVETGGHPQAVAAVYNGEVDFATAYFSPPLKPEEAPPWQPGDDPDIPDDLVDDCVVTPDDKLMCGDWRVLDARTMIRESAPDVVQKLRILDISPPIANDTMSFGPDFPADLRAQIENAMVAFAETEGWWDSIGSSDFYGWQGLSPATDADYDSTREIVTAAGITLDNWGQPPIGSPEHPIKILFMPYVETQVILDGGGVMANYLHQETGLSFEVIVPSSDAATVEGMCASPDDSMGFLPGFGYVLANELCGVDVSFKAIRHGLDAYWAEILVPRDSTIQSVADLDGLTWGIPDDGSQSGYMAPMAMWNRAGITPGDIIETGGHAQAVMAVYNNEVDFATPFFSPPLKPEGEPPWQPGDDPDIPDELVDTCGIVDGRVLCSGWRVMDSRTMISSEKPDVVQKVRILEISPPVANDPISFSPDFPTTLRTQIENAMAAFADSGEWWDSIGRSDFYGWQGISPASDADYDFTREIVAAVAFDIDDDNIADVEDNAPTRYNPDQSDIDSDNIGDVADLCPADATNTCNENGSASESIGVEGGVLSTPDGNTNLDIPTNALTEETSISVTDIGSGFVLNSDLGETTAVYGVEIGPPGTTFATPITLVMTWPDDNDDGFVDTTTQSEAELFIIKDGIVITDVCANEPVHCDQVNNTFSVQVSSLSMFALAALNASPIADAGGPYLGAVNTPIEFDGTGSSDPDNDSLTYTWDFGDTSTGSGATPVYSYITAGIYDVCLTVNDGYIDSEPGCTLAVVYDPEGGFVTGGGWIWSPAGAYVADPTLGGKATFGFVSKYKKGTTEPTGNTEFQFHVADLNFTSTSYDWLVVNQDGTNAQFKGEGTINGADNYKFMLWAGDGSPDTFRIKIWDKATEAVVYDNQLDAAEDADPVTALGGGSIVVHKEK